MSLERLTSGLSARWRRTVWKCIDVSLASGHSGNKERTTVGALSPVNHERETNKKQTKQNKAKWKSPFKYSKTDEIYLFIYLLIYFIMLFCSFDFVCLLFVSERARLNMINEPVDKPVFHVRTGIKCRYAEWYENLTQLKLPVDSTSQCVIGSVRKRGRRQKI